MNLPHRKEYKATIPVQARYRGKRSFHLTAEHISKDGMFLATRNLSMPINSNIELEFSIGNVSYNIPAIIIDDCSDGIFVGFHQLQPEAYRAFHEWQQEASQVSCTTMH